MIPISNIIITLLVVIILFQDYMQVSREVSSLQHHHFLIPTTKCQSHHDSEHLPNIIPTSYL